METAVAMARREVAAPAGLVPLVALKAAVRAAAAKEVASAAAASGAAKAVGARVLERSGPVAESREGWGSEGVSPAATVAELKVVVAREVPAGWGERKEMQVLQAVGVGLAVHRQEQAVAQTVEAARVAVAAAAAMVAAAAAVGSRAAEKEAD